MFYASSKTVDSKLLLTKMKMASFSFLVKKKQFPEEARLVKVGGHMFIEGKTYRSCHLHSINSVENLFVTVQWEVT
jgi:hypothetical protein